MFQQDLGADAVDLRFVPALLGALQLGKRIVNAPESGINLAGTGSVSDQARWLLVLSSNGYDLRR